ncbi:hypothetical protein acdb102_20720 [Acidothermaceae bacterium B102]|nr:hypothetical protein acdb102_20720 [Acidothermaceae bacterium B102]
MKTGLAAGAVLAGLAVSLLGLHAAEADPSPGNGPPLVGGGASLTLPVMNVIATHALVNGVVQLGTTGRTGCPRLATTSATARAQLIASLQAGDGCVQWFRSTDLDLTP